MKQIITAMAVIATLVSCGQNKQDASSEQSAQEQSATGQSPKEPAAIHDNMVMSDAKIPEPTKAIDTTLIIYDDANKMIQRYHKKIQLGKNSNQRVAFILNAVALRDYLNANTDLDKLDVYLACGAEDSLTLVYIGAKDSSGIIVEKPYLKPDDDTKYMFDRVYPCPTCPRSPLHTYKN